MFTSPQQLPKQLARGLAPLYFIHGEEPFQAREASDAVRRAAQQAGYDERVVLDVTPYFDWNQLAMEAGSLSLFASLRLIELRMPTGKPGMEGGKALRAWAVAPPEGVLLLITADKLDGSTTRNAWYKALEAAGSVVNCKHLTRTELAQWITARAQDLGLTLAGEAAMLLAENSEGNMLACHQELEKLALTHPAARIGTEELLAALFDNARYNVFTLVDTALRGELEQTLRIVQSLEAEGTAEPIMVWALARETRLLASMATAIAAGANATAVMKKHRVWSTRTALVGTALRRLKPGLLNRLLLRLGDIDRCIKGERSGHRCWDELARVSAALATAGR